MQISMQFDRSGGFEEAVRRVQRLEAAGLDILWIPESYSFDSVTQLGYLAAKTTSLRLASGILNTFSRTPATVAMTFAGLDYVSGGRAICGLGASGPQVVEGFHGLPYELPLSRLVEYIKVCRMAWRRERLELQGRAVSIPLPEGCGTGLGKALKLIDVPARSSIPIWWAALTPKAVEAAATHADGWLPSYFIPERADRVWGEALRNGLTTRASDLPPLQIAGGGPVAIGDDLPVDELRNLGRARLALYVGGMGPRGHNFYNDLARMYGYEDAAEELQDLYLAGKKQEAAARVPATLLEETSLIGTEAYVRERIAAFKEAGVTVLMVAPVGGDSERTIAQLRSIVDSG